MAMPRYAHHRGLALLVLLLGAGTSNAADLRLIEAAAHADWPTVRTLLNDSAAVRAAAADGMTALHWAAQHDELAAAQALLTAGAVADATNSYGVTPLQVACVNGNADLITALLVAGADANASARGGGESMLMIAARTGRVAAVQALLKHGARVAATDKRGQTALMWAAAEGHVEVVNALITAGAEVAHRLDSGFTALLFAAREGRLAVVDALLSAKADPNDAITTKRKGGRRAPRPHTSALLFAVENAHFEVALRLVAAGADANDQRTGYTPLHTLTWVRRPKRGDDDSGQPPPDGSGSVTSLEFVRELVRRGAHVDARLAKGVPSSSKLSLIGATPFFLAAKNADLPYMQVLIELGADPLLPNQDGATALMAAAGLGCFAPTEEPGSEDECLAAVDYLVSLGAKVDTIDQNRETAMHGAAYKSLPKMVHRLAHHGARIDQWNHKNRFGWTPLLIAEGYRPGNFKPSAETITAIHAVMVAAGVPPPPPTIRPDPTAGPKGYEEPSGR